MNRWHVVQTQAQRERLANWHLRNQKYRTFLPICIEKSERKGPLFPGYLFVDLDTSIEQWHSINGTVGVLRLICNRELPAPVPEGVVEEIQSRAVEGVIDLRDPPEKPIEFSPGEFVKLVDGPLSGRLGIYQSRAKDRIYLLLDIMGRSVKHIAPANHVVPLNGTAALR
jgi:transcription antitermination factor NusG